MKVKHEGLHINRLHPDAGNPLEVAYAQEWAKENTVQTGRPTPLLAHLLSNNGMQWDFTQRDATVAATIIQWLGSHVGQSFLYEVAKKAKKVQHA